MDKPEGWTSHDVVAVVRGVLAVRRVGHGGTLDPFATGVLPLLVGAATKFERRMHEAPKAYDAVIRFGRETATDDRDGATTREAPAPRLDGPALETAIAALRGVIEQTPPAYSAVKVDGRRAYARARAGESVELAARHVQVYRLEVVERKAEDLRVLVVCSSGTYVRAIARDLGRALGSAAHLAALRRLAVGALETGDALTPTAVRSLGRDRVLAALRPAEDAVLALAPRFLKSPAATLVSSGESA